MKRNARPDRLDDARLGDRPVVDVEREAASCATKAAEQTTSPNAISQRGVDLVTIRPTSGIRNMMANPPGDSTRPACVAV